LSRLFYTLSQAIKHKRALKELGSTAVKALPDLPFQKWRDVGVRAIAFDFDGVLATQSELVPSSEGKQALESALALFPGCIFILSNNPLKAREDYFKAHYPDVRFIVAKKKKPHPDGLQHIATLAHFNPSELMLIDDRLLTGGLACLIAKAQFCYFSQAKTNFAKKPFKETFWLCVRYLEKAIFL
jgi:predicted HAD superfamily phosphohydrolase YqeG